MARPKQQSGYHHRTKWQQNFSWRLGFSPSGNLGVTVGMSLPLANYPVAIARTTDQGRSWTIASGEKLQGFPHDISLPSDRLAYILCDRRLIKYSYPK